MARARYKVVGSYVTLKVAQVGGGEAVVGLYRDAPVPEAVDEASLAHHLAKGMVAPAEEPAVESDKPKPRRSAG